MLNPAPRITERRVKVIAQYLTWLRRRENDEPVPDDLRLNSS